MRRPFNFIKSVLAILAICAVLFFIFDELRFLDTDSFVSPLEEEIKLVIRDDIYGKGHFGARRKGGRRHNGIDLEATLGTNVYALKSGWVVGARESKGMGKYVEVYHGNGLITIYGHLDSVEAKMLERVKQGHVIGRVGKTGNAEYKNMKTHLHLEVIKDGEYQDAAQFLPLD